MNRKLISSLLTLLVSSFVIQALHAAGPIPVVIEFEPNNIPKQAVRFTAPAILSGTMSGDDQDAYLWRISDADALKRWNLKLHGIPKALTGISILRVKYGQNPNSKEPSKQDIILGFDTILNFGIRDGSRPIERNNVFLPAGDYIVGLFQAGSKDKFQPPSPSAASNALKKAKNNEVSEQNNAYRLIIKEGLKTTYSRKNKNKTKLTAIKLNPGRGFNSYKSLLGGESWYSILIDDQAATSLWTIKGELMIERSLTAALYNKNGEELTKVKSDKNGHFILPDLALKKGQHFIKLLDENQVPAALAIRIIETGAVSKGSELEPNNKWARANIIDLTEPLNSKIDTPNEGDFYRFKVSEPNQNEIFKLSLNSSKIESIKLCLLTSDGKDRSCRTGKPPLILDGLSLNAGEHGLWVGRSKKASGYSISKKIINTDKSAFEFEPNDKPDDASVFSNTGLIKGTLSKQDKDYFTLNVRKEPQLWRLQAVGQKLHDLTYHPQDGQRATSVRASKSSKRLRLDNLYLLPGTHRFSLTGTGDTKYILRALALGQPNLLVEREPNNDFTNAQKIMLGDKRVGLIAELDDRDYYRFHLPGKQAVQLNFIAPVGGQFNVDLYWDRQSLKNYILPKGKGINARLELETGDYYIIVTAKTASEAEYELNISNNLNLATVSDIEPNDTSYTASVVPDSWVLQGSVGSSRAAKDWYRLANLEKPLSIRIKSKGKPRLQIVDRNRKTITKLIKIEKETWQADLPENKETYFYISGAGEYRFDISFDQNEIDIQPTPPVLPVSIAFVDGDDTVAAYREMDQNLMLQANLSNESNEDITLALKAKTIDDKWYPKVSKDSYEIKAGETITIAIDVSVSKDAWPDMPVILQLIARDDLNRISVATKQLFAKRFIDLIAPEFSFDIPPQLHGAINIASAAMGATILSKVRSTVNIGYLIDGLASVGDYFTTNRDSITGAGKIRPEIKLAGDYPQEVIGFSFHPFGLQGNSGARQNTTKVKVELSTDGKSYKTALITQLSAFTKEQFFTLDEPVLAHFARLTLLDSKDKDRLALGEWKVLAKPETITKLSLANIAAPELGGHIVWLTPHQPTAEYATTMLSAKNDSIHLRYIQADVHQWVVAFNHNRAALIESINWLYEKESTEQRYIGTDIYISLDSPLGPWEKLPNWSLDNSVKNALMLEKPRWVRYIKFVPKVDSMQKNGSRIEAPDQIQIFEARNGKVRSILGEWGHSTSKGPYEAENQPKIISRLYQSPSHVTQAQAKQLEQSIAIASKARLGEYKNWYQITIPADKNSLSITLSGNQTLGVTAKLLKAANEEIPWVTKDRTTNSLRYEAHVQAGTYYIQVQEPPRSVVFTWDTSGSTVPVRPIIQQAVLSYIKEVKPGLDEAHMLPFGASFLSKQWLDQPYMLQSVLNDYNGSGNSSAAESALVQAAEILRNKDGQKIIVIITDAATNKDNALWRTLGEVRPRIIAIGVSSKGNLVPTPANEQDLLQDWASSANGYYDYAASVAQVERAFDRASSKIRQPAEYQIIAKLESKAPSKPGFLEVTSVAGRAGEVIELPEPTIEVILDASGSMFSKMGDKRRYEIAREVLVDLVENTLPAKAKFGLRVFGHKESGSCRTDLEIPIAPLDKGKVVSIINKIAPKSYAKTPIAASLLAVAKDLSKVKGEKTILLITDGKETCEGDPAEAIEKLKEQGVSAKVNIIGFAIDNAELEVKFRRWARLGNGEYQQAIDGTALLKSIKKLSKRKFTLSSSKGKAMGEYYTDGAPIELPVGDYLLDFSHNIRKRVSIIENKTILIKVGK